MAISGAPQSIARASRLALAATSALAPAILMLPGLAHAAAAAADAEQGALAVEEVVVTAQKRSERLQEVPVAVTAITGTRAREAGVVNMLQLQEIVPGVVTNQKTLNSSPFLRGLGVGTSQPGLESSVASYVDNVYIPNPVASSFNLNSVQQIEVLRGPQGTLFGRNASAGVVALYTENPSSSPALRADVSYDNYEALVGRLYVTGPIAPNLSANFSLYTNDQHQGWGRQIFLDQPMRREESVNTRAKLLWNMNDSTDLLLSGWYIHFRSDIGSSQLYPGTFSTNGFGCPTCGFFEAAQGMASFGKGTSYGVSAKLDHDLGFARVTNIFAYQEAKPYFLSDADHQPANIQLVVQHSEEDTLTNETQLVSTGEGPLKWVVGFFYMHDKINFEQTISGTSAAAGNVTRSSIKTDSFAPFGQATYALSPSTNITVGLRYTIDKRERDGLRGNFAGLTPVASAKATFKDPTWRLALDQKFAEDIMGYVSYSRGFKAGILNVAEITGPPVDPETIDSYEAGLKTQFFDRRLLLNISAFYYTAKGLQLRALIPGTPVVVVTNAADAEGYGVDVDFEATVTDRLRVSGGFESLDAEFTDFPSATLSTPRPPNVGGNLTFLGDATGNRLPYAARFSGNVGVHYRVPLESLGELRFNANYSYRSRVYFEPDPRLFQKPNGIFNASVGWRSPDEKWEVTAWGRNLTDERYAASATVANATASQIQPGQPRTVGVTLGAKF